MSATKYLQFPSANRALGVSRSWTLVIDGAGAAIWYSTPRDRGGAIWSLDHERRATPEERQRVLASAERARAAKDAWARSPEASAYETAKRAQFEADQFEADYEDAHER